MQAAIIFLCVGVGIIHLSSIVLLIFSLKAEKRTDKKLWEIQAINRRIQEINLQVQETARKSFEKSYSGYDIIYHAPQNWCYVEEVEELEE